MQNTEMTIPLERNPSQVMPKRIIGFLTATTSVIVLRFLNVHIPKFGFSKGNYTRLAFSALVISAIFQGINFVITFPNIFQCAQIKRYHVEISIGFSMIPGWYAAMYLVDQEFLPSQYKIFFLAISAFSLMYVHYTKEINERFSHQKTIENLSSEITLLQHRNFELENSLKKKLNNETIDDLLRKITQLRQENYQLEQTLYKSCPQEEELSFLKEQYHKLMERKKQLLNEMEKMKKQDQNCPSVNVETNSLPTTIDRFWGEMILLRVENYRLEEQLCTYYSAEGRCAFLNQLYDNLKKDYELMKLKCEKKHKTNNNILENIAMN